MRKLKRIMQSLLDANKNIILLSYRAEQERLENEMRLAYQVYTSCSTTITNGRGEGAGNYACVYYN